MLLNDFKSVWLVKFEYDQPLGEQIKPVSLHAEEMHSGRTIEGLPSDCPYDLGNDDLFVTFDGAANIGCHISLGWSIPANIIDLYAEFRCQTAGLEVERDWDAALGYFAVESQSPLKELFHNLIPGINKAQALERGRYTVAVAHMERNGIPVDYEAYEILNESWPEIQVELIKEIDKDYGVFNETTFQPRKWREWLYRNHISWPLKAPKILDLSMETFRDMANLYPEVLPIREALSTLRQNPATLDVGSDGRNRSQIRPFATKTGRNAPSTTHFIFGQAVWIRHLIQPEQGMALAYLDYQQQEFGIAAALSGDAAMIKAYESGDPYLSFAKQAGVIPENATRESHTEVRRLFKQCALGVQYGMGQEKLAQWLGTTRNHAAELIQLHKSTFSDYWKWSNAVVEKAKEQKKMQSSSGWSCHVTKNSKMTSIRNFPLQAHGADMLRLGCSDLIEHGIQICAPVHDAILIESPLDEIVEAVETTQNTLAQASSAVLGGFKLGVDPEFILAGERFQDERGKNVSNLVRDIIRERRCRMENVTILS